jgi:hypothetical protein
VTAELGGPQNGQRCATPGIGLTSTIAVSSSAWDHLPAVQLDRFARSGDPLAVQGNLAVPEWEYQVAERGARAPFAPDLPSRQFESVVGEGLASHSATCPPGLRRGYGSFNPSLGSLGASGQPSVTRVETVSNRSEV